MIFRCPTCNVALGELATSGSQKLFCASCRFKYQVVSGRIERSDSREVTLHEQTVRKSGEYEREYEFRLGQEDGGVVPVTVRIPGRDDRFRPKEGDSIAIVSAMRGEAAENVIALVNQTTGRITTIGLPGELALQKALGLALLSAIVVAALLPGALGTGMGALLTLLVFGIVLYVAQEKLKPRHEIPAGRHAALLRSASLLEQKATLEGRIEAVEQDRREKIAIRDKLLALQAKMREVGVDLYQTRIDRIDGALPLLDEQIALDGRLLHAYARTLKMVEIELESDSAADAIPDNVAAELDARAMELAAIESRTEDVKRLLSANEEVERLLRSG